MFSELQLMLLAKERERELIGEGHKRALLHVVKQAKRTAHIHHERRLLKPTLVRALAIALLVVLLALGLNTIARAQTPLVLPAGAHLIQGHLLTLLP